MLRIKEQKIIMILIMGLIILSTGVLANPYTGINRIGAYYSYTTELSNNYYGTYRAPPRAGGWFGGGVTWITGLRAPYYSCLAPRTISTFNQPNCGNYYYVNPSPVKIWRFYN